MAACTGSSLAPAPASDSIPNDDLPHDDWIKVGLALYAALGAGGRALWESWSSRADKNDPEYTAEQWDSFAGVRSVTLGALFWLARQNGWSGCGPRALVFQTAVMTTKTTETPAR